MKTLAEILKEIFNEIELNYQNPENQNIFTFRIKADNTDISMMINCDDAQQTIYCYADFPVKTPQLKHIAVIRTINRINYSYPYATLALDESDGQLMARSVMNTDDGAVNSKVVLALMQGCMNIIDGNLKEIMGIIFNTDEVFTEDKISNHKVIHGLN